LVGLVLVMAACSTGDGQNTEAQPTTSDPTTTSAPATTTETASSSSETAVDTGGGGATPEGCDQTVNLPGAPNPNGFVLVPEDDIFRCYGVTSFRSQASASGLVGGVFTAVDIFSEQSAADGSLRARALVDDSGEQSEYIRVDDTLWGRDDDGGWTQLEVSIDDVFGGELFQPQLTVAGVGATAVMFLGGAAQPVGEENIAGRSLIRYEADAEQIGDYLNGLRLIPSGRITLTDGSITIWATDAGLVAKVLSEVKIEDVLLDGVPIQQADLSPYGLTEEDLASVPDFVFDFELYDWDAEVEISRPQ
jgi:hypothetical protein